MQFTIPHALSIAALTLLATGAFAADQLGASNNQITQTNSGARAEQRIRIGVVNAPVFGSTRVNTNNNKITQSNSTARTKQRIDIGVVK
jgi:hypothetical protein